MAGSDNPNVAADRLSVIRVRRMRLTVIRGPNKGQTHVSSERRIRVGKAPDNELTVPHDTVSRHHFEVVRDAWGYLLRDLESTNGTYLDGAEIREAYLKTGSVITAGQTKIKFRTQEDHLEVNAWPHEHMGPLTGRSRAMRLVFGAVEAAARLDVPVLLLGETGTGRKSLAALIHEKQSGRDDPRIELDCTNTGVAELKRMLFGTGRPTGGGLLTGSQRGTLTLLEPWELPADLQAQMVKALESGSRKDEAGADKTPTRGTVAPPARLRLLTVSTRSLDAEAEHGRMDPRLASHLGNVQIHVPPLRDRPEDIEAVLEHRLQVDQNLESATSRLPSVLVRTLMGHPWPGNVPELLVFVDTWLASVSTGADPAFLHLLDAGEDINRSFRHHKRNWVDTFERQYLARLMHHCQGNVSMAARQAGMDRKYLNNLLKRHGFKE